MLELPTQGKEIKGIEIGKQKDMMAYAGNLVKYIFLKLLELNKFCKETVYKINI